MTRLIAAEHFDVASTSNNIRTQSREKCYLCGQAGQLIHRELSDRLYGVAGKWSFRQCVDPTCELVWLDPMPIKEDIAKAYTKYFTHVTGNYSPVYWLRQRVKRGFAGLAYGYAASTLLVERVLTIPIFLFPFLKEQIAATGFMYLRGEQTGKVLEIGCGDGSLLNNLRELGWEVEGVDFDPGAVKTAREHHHLCVRLGAVEQQGYLGNSFDAIVMSHVIEHVHDPIQLLMECKRLLKPFGKLVITTPNLNSLGYQTFQSSWLSLDPPRHLYLFSSSTLAEIAQRCGFSITTIRTTARAANQIWLASKAISGNGKLSAGRKSLEKIRAKVFQINEAIRLFYSTDAGEELLLIAENKPK